MFAHRDTDAVSITAEPGPGREDGPDIPEETAEPAAARPPAAPEAAHSPEGDAHNGALTDAEEDVRKEAEGEAEKGDPDDPFAGLVLDASFVKAAATKEQSARTRMLAARWKDQPPNVVPFRAEPEPRRRLFRRRPPELDPWGQPVRRKRRMLIPWPWQVLTAVILVLALLNPGAARRMFAGTPAHQAAVPSGTPTVTLTEPTPSATPSPADDPGVPTVAHPFAGSPAANWVSGADAIVLPAATAYGNVSASRVAANLQRVKQFLVATNLDPAVLTGATPTTALGLVDPAEVDHSGVTVTTLWKKWLAHPTPDDDPLAVFSRFDPKQALLVGTTVKVQGKITLGSDGHNGTRITADYTFVYPVRSPASDALLTRTIVRRVESFDVVDSGQYTYTPGYLWVHQWESDSGNSACADTTGYFTPQFDDQAEPSGPTPSGPAVDPYDRSKPLDATGTGCGTVTRT